MVSNHTERRTRREVLTAIGAGGTIGGLAGSAARSVAAQDGGNGGNREGDGDGSIVWSQLLGDTGHRNYVERDTGPREESALRWEIPASDVPTPIYADGRLYAMLADGFVLAVPTTGRPVVQLHRLPDRATGIIHQGDTIFCNDTADTLVALNDETGEVRWRRTFPDEILQPVFTNGLLFYQTADNRTFVLDPESGGIVDRYGTPFGSGTDSPGYLVTDDDAVYGNVWNSGVFARSIDDGTISWTREIDEGAVPPVLADNALYFASNGDAPIDVFAVTATSGEAQWSTTVDSRWATHLVVGNSRLFVGGDRLYALDRETGLQEWVSGLEPLNMVGAGGTLYVIVADGDGDDVPGPLVAIDTESGIERWRHSFDEEAEDATQMAITDAGLAVGYGNKLYLFGD